jgi:hypothetical protein
MRIWVSGLLALMFVFVLILAYDVYSSYNSPKEKTIREIRLQLENEYSK